MGGCVEKLFTPQTVERKKHSKPDIQLLSTNAEEHAVGKIDQESQKSERKRLVALYDYKSRNADDLSFQKSDQFTLINPEGDWWFVKSFRTDAEGYVPCNYVAEAGTLHCEDWFHGTITRKDSERLLVNHAKAVGCYLIRESETAQSSYSLSILNEDTAHRFYVKHYRIHIEGDEFYVTKHVQFKDLKSLVKYYSDSVSHGLCCQLTESCPKNEVPQTLSIAKNVFIIEESKIERIQKLEDEGTGEVYKALWNTTMVVATKSSSFQAISEEINAMKKLHHKRLVKFYGVIQSAPAITIVWEFMRNGSLLHYLRIEGGKDANLSDQIDIIAQVAHGMAYLESKDFAHGSLCAANVMVGIGPVYKVADYGVYTYSEDLSLKHSMFLWMSPEAILHSISNIKADVWSFGILATEVVTKGIQPYFPTEYGHVHELSEKLQTGYRMPKPEQCPDAVYELLLLCWNNKVDLRPTFEYIQIFLEGFFQRPEIQNSEETT